MVQPLLRAVSQLDDRVFLGTTLRALVLSLLSFAALIALSVWLLQDWVGQNWVGQGGWLGWLAGLLGGFGVLLAGVWLFVPVAMLIAALYVERVARAVERRWYPEAPPVAPAPWAEQAWDGIVLAVQVGLLQVASIVLSLLLPGVGLVLGLFVTGWAIGRGLCVAVAMRRLPREAALDAYRARWLPAVGCGVVFALIGHLPPLNLLVPVLGIAAMVHVLHAPTGVARRGTAGL